MDNSRKLETEGPFAGLWVRVARALRKAGYINREEIRADIESGSLHPFRPVRDYGRYADRDVRKWLGLKSWEEQWANVPYSVISNYPESVRGKGLFGEIPKRRKRDTPSSRRRSSRRGAVPGGC